MVEAYKRFFRNYANFNGRSSRSDYWFVFLFNILISWGLSFIGSLIPSLSAIVSVLSMLYSLVILIPNIAIIVRRLHDINKSGWFCFIALIPIVGLIVLLIFLCTNSVDDNNHYGARV